MACIWQPLGYAPGHTVAISRQRNPHGDFYKCRVLFLLTPSPRWDLSNNHSVVWGAVFFPSLPPWGLLSSPQSLWFPDLLSVEMHEGTRGIIKFSCWTTVFQHKVPSERAFKVRWMEGGGLTKANVFSRFLYLIIKTWPLRIIKDGIILIRINYKYIKPEIILGVCISLNPWEVRNSRNKLQTPAWMLKIAWLGTVCNIKEKMIHFSKW